LGTGGNDYILNNATNYEKQRSFNTRRNLKIIVLSEAGINVSAQQHCCHAFTPRVALSISI
jgi:hypothetical protein